MCCLDMRVAWTGGGGGTHNDSKARQCERAFGETTLCPTPHAPPPGGLWDGCAPHALRPPAWPPAPCPIPILCRRRATSLHSTLGSPSSDSKALKYLEAKVFALATSCAINAPLPMGLLGDVCAACVRRAGGCTMHAGDGPGRRGERRSRQAHVLGHRCDKIPFAGGCSTMGTWGGGGGWGWGWGPGDLIVEDFRCRMAEGQASALPTAELSNSATRQTGILESGEVGTVGESRGGGGKMGGYQRDGDVAPTVTVREMRGNGREMEDKETKYPFFSPLSPISPEVEDLPLHSRRQPPGTALPNGPRRPSGGGGGGARGIPVA